VALIDGEAGLAQYADSRVHALDVQQLRRRVSLQPDAGLAAEAATVELTFKGGERRAAHVPHARGSLQRPLTDSELNSKFQTLVDPIIGGRSAALIECVARLPAAPDLTSLMRIVAP
jgi:2-methylcitrate dehydratase PrpD